MNYSIFIFIILLFSPFIVETLNLSITSRCNLSDDKCKKIVYRKIYQELSRGDVNLQIPEIDPMKITMAVFTLPKTVSLTIEDGTVTGLRNCSFDNFQTILTESPYHTVWDLICDIEINGDSTLVFSKKLEKEITGHSIVTDSVTGHGKLKIKIDKLHFHLDMPFIIKRSGSDIFVISKKGSIFDILHKPGILTIEGLNVGANTEVILNHLRSKLDELNIIAIIRNRLLEYFQAYLDNYLAKMPATSIYTNTEFPD